MRITTLAMVLIAFAGVIAAAEPTDQSGRAHAWQGPSDGYTVIDFAASWCRPCWKVLPKLQAFAADHPEVRVLVVSVDDEQKGRDALVERLKLTVPVLWDGTHEIARHYEPAGMPATFVLDPRGTIVYRHVGSADEDWKALMAFIDGLAR